MWRSLRLKVEVAVNRRKNDQKNESTRPVERLSLRDLRYDCQAVGGNGSDDPMLR